MKIVEALKRNLDAQPDRSGSKPLDYLAENLQALSPTSVESDDARAALIFLIENPADGFEGANGKKYWRGLTFLSANLQTHDPRNLATAFYAKLFGPMALEGDLRVFALNGTVKAGKKLTRSELNDLADVCESNPIAWLNAAIFASEFSFACENAKALLAQNKLNLNAFILSLEGWRDRWQIGVNFGDVVTEFRDAASNEEARAKLERWMDQRGTNSATKPRQEGRRKSR